MEAAGHDAFPLADRHSLRVVKEVSRGGKDEAAHVVLDGTLGYSLFL